MGMRAVNDCFGRDAPLVDKMIGSAFPLVKTVAEHIDEINYIVANMQTLVNLANGVTPEMITTFSSLFATMLEAFPTSLPSEAGVVWNNGGVICTSQ